MTTVLVAFLCFGIIFVGAAIPAGANRDEPAVRATDFVSHKVYQSQQRPGYTSWVSFFPGRDGRWYLSCEEVTRPSKPLPRAPRQWWYEMSLPCGYDKSQDLMEVVLLESDDGLQTWKVISRQPSPFQHSAGSFAQARTRDGRFLRFLWAAYALDRSVKPSEILYESRDNGQTWAKLPAFHNGNFASYPHRLRTLRDGTLAVCVPLGHRWGEGTDYPTRASIRLDVVADMQMMLYFSNDDGRTWSGPLPIFAGQSVSETDFVELPDGNLLFFNNSIFANPGRQFVYRDGNTLTPGPLERVHSGTVPETVCLTEDGVLIGCMRAGAYFWSDDLGQTWERLEGAPDTMEVYQPWIQYLGDGRVACAGHYGADDPVGGRDQYVSIHTFRVQVARKRANTRLWIARHFDEAKDAYLNEYTISLTADGAPLADKEIEVWYVARDAPGYDSWNSKPLEERMKMGGKQVMLHTGVDGTARLSLPEFDGITDVHRSYQIVARFNRDNSDPAYKPGQLAQVEFYAYGRRDAPEATGMRQTD